MQQRLPWLVGIRRPEPDCHGRFPVSIGQRSGGNLEGNVKPSLKAKDAVGSRWECLGSCRWNQERAGELVTPLLLLARPTPRPPRTLSLASRVEKGVPELMADAKAESMPGDRLAGRRTRPLPAIGWLRIDSQVEEVSTGVWTEIGLHRPRRTDPCARDAAAERFGQLEDIYPVVARREFLSQQRGRLFGGENQYLSNIDSIESR